VEFFKDENVNVAVSLLQPVHDCTQRDRGST